MTSANLYQAVIAAIFKEKYKDHYFSFLGRPAG